MTTIAILCSGQGAQGPGMFDLVADAPAAQPVFAAAKTVLGGRDPRDLALGGDDLHANAVAQVLCCAAALAAWAALGPGLAGHRIVVAGYSVGEVAAWGVAGAAELAVILDVVALRAALMDEAVAEPSGLIAVGGLGRAAIERLCRDAGTHVAIRNAADRVVLGGPRDALERARALALEAGAERVTPIPVAVPSHTPLMRSAADAFAIHLRGRVDLRPPALRLLSGIDGDAVFSVRDGLDKLARQVAETVDWAACMAACRAFGATRALELGPGHALARMTEAMPDQGDGRGLDEFRTLDGALRWATR